MLQACRSLISLLAAAAIVVSGGCSPASRNQQHLVARFIVDPDAASAAPQVIERVQYNGRYNIVAGERNRTNPIPRTEMLLEAGDSVGFLRNDDGSITAIALRTELPIGKLSKTATYLAWQPIELYIHESDTGKTRLASAGMTALVVFGAIILFVALLFAGTDSNDYAFD